MAHILIGLYHSLAEAEGIVHALVEQGFARPCLTLATPHATLPAPEHLGLQTWSTLEGEQGLRRRLLDLGVPDSEVHTYTEAVRQGDTLVVVQASAEQAERGLDILHGPRLADPQTGRPHWQYLGHVGVISHGDPTPHTAPERVDTPGLARAETDFRQHQAATAPESGLTSLEYEPAYRYGYDVGQRFPEQDWGTLEAGLRAGWERWHPGTWERFKDAIRYGWETVRGHLEPVDHRGEAAAPAAYRGGLRIAGPQERESRCCMNDLTIYATFAESWWQAGSPLHLPLNF